MAGPAAIRPLPDAAVARLRATVILSDVAQAAAELVQNALDAEATAVRVWVAAAGGDLRIDVADDGVGISPADLDLVGRRYHTSKRPPDQPSERCASPVCYGFRGEALASLGEVAVTTITTRTGATRDDPRAAPLRLPELSKRGGVGWGGVGGLHMLATTAWPPERAPEAWRLVLAPGGSRLLTKVAEGEAGVPARGTHVTARDFFALLPVRRRRLVRPHVASKCRFGMGCLWAVAAPVSMRTPAGRVPARRGSADPSPDRGSRAGASYSIVSAHRRRGAHGAPTGATGRLHRVWVQPEAAQPKVCTRSGGMLDGCTDGVVAGPVSPTLWRHVGRRRLRRAMPARAIPSRA